MAQITYTGNLDILTRTYLNDFFWNNYYYFWTSFWFIPLLVTTITLILYTTFMNIYSKSLFLIVIAVGITYYEITDYWLMNVDSINLTVHTESINTLLTNSINKFHPFIFYLSLQLFFVYGLSEYTRSRGRTRLLFTPLYFQTTSINSYRSSLFMIAYTLFLGSWWAVQEGSWGGWWNWDPSEMFGFLVMVFLIIILHKQLNYQISWIVSKQLISFLIAIVVTYLFIQLNFNLVSHNFGLKVSQFVNTTQLFLILLVCMIIFSLVLGVGTLSLFTKYFINSSNGKLNYSSQLRFHKTPLVLLITALFIISFLPLINDFFWKLLQIDIIWLGVNFNTLLIYVTLLTSLFFWRVSSNLSVLMMYIMYMKTWALAYLVSCTSQRTFIVSVHFLFTVFLVLNLVVYNKLITTWVLDGLHPIHTYYNTTLSYHLLNPSFNSTCLELSTPFLVHTSVLSNVYTFFSVTSTSTLELFTQSMDNTATNQSLLQGLFHNVFAINILDLSLNPVYSLFVILLLTLYVFLRRKYLIIF